MSHVFCGFCLDRGCLMCDAHRAARIREQEEAANVRDFLVSMEVDIRAAHPEMIALVHHAILWGIGQERERNAAVSSASNAGRGRFDCLEVGD